MRALLVTAPHTYDWLDVPLPQPGTTQALVRNFVCGVCNSTDAELIEGTQCYRPPFPYLLGHEAVGEVLEVGAEASRFQVGDLVTRANCPPPPGINSAWGGFAEYGLVSQTGAQQIVLPPGIEPEWAFMAIALSETRAFLDQVMELSRPLAGRPLVVLGTGIAGLTACYWGKVAGASQVIALGRRPSRLELALRSGADHALDTRITDLAGAVADLTGGGAHTLIEATGRPALLAQMGGLLAPNAVVGIYGAADGAAYQAAAAQLPAGTQIHRPGPEEQRWVRRTAEQMLSGEVDASVWRSHVWHWSEIKLAFAQVAAGEVIKGCVRFDR